MFIAEEEGLEKRKIKIKIKLQKDVEIFFLIFKKFLLSICFSARKLGMWSTLEDTPPPPPPLGKVNWP